MHFCNSKTKFQFVLFFFLKNKNENQNLVKIQATRWGHSSSGSLWKFNEMFHCINLSHEMLKIHNDFVLTSTSIAFSARAVCLCRGSWRKSIKCCRTWSSTLMSDELDRCSIMVSLRHKTHNNSRTMYVKEQTNENLDRQPLILR